MVNEDDKRLFDECIQDAITLSRKYMKDKKVTTTPTNEEFQLACMMYVRLMI